jgi:DNA polymerase-3 subunit epsilon
VKILAIDFETAHSLDDIKGKNAKVQSSGCALGLAMYDSDTGQITTEYYQFRPEPFYMDPGAFGIHGISLNDLENSPTFDVIYLDYIKKRLLEANLVIAHNADFDITVLNNALQFYGYKVPKLNIDCTCKMSRKLFPDAKNNLDAVARRYNIPLDHHNGRSDALACLKIYLKMSVDTNIA